MDGRRGVRAFHRIRPTGRLVHPFPTSLPPTGRGDASSVAEVTRAIVSKAETLAHGGEQHSTTSLADQLVDLAPLIVVAAAFLIGISMAGDKPRAEDGAITRAPEILRWTVIVGLLIATVAHLPVTPEHLDEAPYMGALFIAFMISAFAVASALAVAPSHSWYLAAALLCAAGIAAYVATRVIAFPRLRHDVGQWAEPLGLVSITAEAVVVALSVVSLRTTTRASTRTGALVGGR